MTVMKKGLLMLMSFIALTFCSGNTVDSSFDDYDDMLPCVSDLVNKTITLQEDFKAFSMLPGTIHFTNKV